VKYREVDERLSKLGCVEISRRGSDSHRKWYNPKLNAKAIVPDWGSKDLRLGTLRSIVKDLGFDWEEFNKA
jgi:mRNA interferase HicA